MSNQDLMIDFFATLISGNVKHYARIPGLLTEDWIRGSLTMTLRDA